MFRVTGLEDGLILSFLVLAIIPIVLFIVHYFLFSPWRATTEGKTMMGQKVAILSVLTLAFLARTFGRDYWGREALTLVVYGALVYFFWKTFLELRRVQKQYPFSRFKKRKPKL